MTKHGPSDDDVSCSPLFTTALHGRSAGTPTRSVTGSHYRSCQNIVIASVHLRCCCCRFMGPSTYSEECSEALVCRDVVNYHVQLCEFCSTSLVKRVVRPVSFTNVSPSSLSNFVFVFFFFVWSSAFFKVHHLLVLIENFMLRWAEHTTEKKLWGRWCAASITQNWSNCFPSFFTFC